MPSIRYKFLAATGIVTFPEGTGLHDDALFTVTGDHTTAEAIYELDGAKDINGTHMRLADDYAAAVSPYEVMNAMGIMGWRYTLDPALEIALEAWEQEQIDRDDIDERVY